MILNAAIRRSDLEAVNGSVGIFESDGVTPVAKLLPGRVYAIKFDVKNNGDGPSSSTETVDAFWVEQGGGGRIIPLTPVNNVISSVNPGGTPITESVMFKAPNDSSTWAGTNLIESNNFKVRIKVNPDNDPNEAQTGDNQATSTIILSVYHVDLTVANVQPANSNANCGPNSVSACTFAVAGEPYDVHFTIRADGTSGRTVPDFTARVQLLDGVGSPIISDQTVNISGFTITNGVGSTNSIVTFPVIPSKTVKAHIIADDGSAPGAVDEAYENDNFMDSGITVHARPVANAGADLIGSYPDSFTLNGTCSTSESGMPLTGQWCPVPNGICGSQSLNFPVQFSGDYPAIGTTNTYRLNCSASIGGTLLVKTEDVNVTGD
jgi:hypothetical protein